jgi:hypothetical protein
MARMVSMRRATRAGVMEKETTPWVWASVRLAETPKNMLEGAASTCFLGASLAPVKRCAEATPDWPENVLLARARLAFREVWMAGYYGCEEYAGYGYMELRPCIMVKHCTDGAEYVAREPVVFNVAS